MLGGSGSSLRVNSPDAVKSSPSTGVGGMKVTLSTTAISLAVATILNVCMNGMTLWSPIGADLC